MRSIAVVVVVVGSGSCFVLDRAEDIAPGSVTGTTVHAGAALAFPAVSIDGAHRVQRGEIDGSFVVGGLGAGAYTLRASVDEDGNGWPELANVQPLAIEETTHGTDDLRATGVLLGEVELAPTIEVQGIVRGVDGTPAAGVIVSVVRADLTEASVGSDVDGQFRFAGLAAGPARLVAVSADGASRFDERVIAAPVDDVILQLTDAPVPGVRLQLVPAPADGTEVFVTLFSAGSADDVDGVVSNGELALALPGSGPFDVFVVVDDRAASSGAVFSQVAADDDQVWGPVILSEVDPCPTDGTPRDCDLDSVAGLPFLLGEPVLAVWTACASACGGLVGTALQQASCPTDDGPFDCDDDGDGQSDVTEPARCANRGADFDGDGLCGVDDPLPQCRSNDPAATDCRSTAVGDARNPPVRPEFGG
ncbi:MAG: carboxypeptidase-like regulatory domain-containing protein [Deltaproteobacteria bacterium]|nr:carboxypeptidase-like regulatory domain-containing protein [Deltaproteobacteria bacterium]